MLTEKTYTGYKFLGANLTSNHDPEFFYPMPTQNKNGAWTPTKWITVDGPKDSKPCGKGLHLMKKLIPRYGRYTGNVFQAEGKELLGEDDEKFRFRQIRLLYPVMPNEIFKPKADLEGADLKGANLRWAHLKGANLKGAYLKGADLEWANLKGANLKGAYLKGATLKGANLEGANLQEADLQEADLKGAFNLPKDVVVK